MKTESQQIIEELIESFQQFSDETNQKYMEAYMKNRFSFFGIKSPLRKELSKPFTAQGGNFPLEEKMEIVWHLFKQPQRELDYVAMEFLEKGYKKQCSIDDIAWIEKLILTNSWWDSVDFIAPKIAGVYFLKFPEKRKPIIDKWIKSGELWLIRSALIFQLKYKDKTDLALLFSIIERTRHTKEFFINKAIGWMLRENSKRIPEIIEDYIDENRDFLAPLSIKEGLRIIYK